MCRFDTEAELRLITDTPNTSATPRALAPVFRWMPVIPKTREVEQSLSPDAAALKWVLNTARQWLRLRGSWQANNTERAFHALEKQWALLVDGRSAFVDASSAAQAARQRIVHLLRPIRPQVAQNPGMDEFAEAQLTADLAVIQAELDEQKAAADSAEVAA